MQKYADALQYILLEGPTKRFLKLNLLHYAVAKYFAKNAFYTESTAATATVEIADFCPINYTECCSPITVWLTGSSAATD